ncbi:aldo/keto reductase [Pedobacter sp. AW31-3R]|uniref:aldo/keto reductase n=1 Tax=Pedobacter sp. AW31-3R TaxID=3445781 RepID=UPI003FA19311
MINRRNFISNAVVGAAAVALTPIIPAFAADLPVEAGSAVPSVEMDKTDGVHYKPNVNFGLGGVAIGNGFKPTTEKEAEAALEASWNAGVRYFDTSPWYGLGLSERRFGHFLHGQKREEYVISTKVGRVLKATKTPPKALWVNPSPFIHSYDYTASGVRRSVEDSLQRLGIDSLDIVYIHDLSEDNGDLGKNWLQQFEIARKGAMPELTRMREEGLIKGWGLGVNTIEPILKTLEVADADIFLSATQYSMMYHEDALNRLFPAIERKKAAVVVGAPLNAGFLAGVDRYDYRGKMPAGYMEKRTRMEAIAKAHGTDLRTAALQFSAAPACVAAVIPGARTAEQAKQNADSMKAKINSDFWKELKQEKLIAANTAEPAA